MDSRNTNNEDKDYAWKSKTNTKELKQKNSKGFKNSVSLSKFHRYNPKIKKEKNISKSISMKKNTNESESLNDSQNNNTRVGMKKKLRDLLRLVNYGRITEEIKSSKLKEIDEIKKKLRYKKEVEKFYLRYKKIKFIEKQKTLRKINKIKKKIFSLKENNSNNNGIDIEIENDKDIKEKEKEEQEKQEKQEEEEKQEEQEETKEVKEIKGIKEIKEIKEEDQENDEMKILQDELSKYENILLYITHYPLNRKYISAYSTCSEKGQAEKEEILDSIKRKLKDRNIKLDQRNKRNASNIMDQLSKDQFFDISSNSQNIKNTGNYANSENEENKPIESHEQNEQNEQNVQNEQNDRNELKEESKPKSEPKIEIAEIIKQEYILQKRKHQKEYINQSHSTNRKILKSSTQKLSFQKGIPISDSVKRSAFNALSAKSKEQKSKNTHIFFE